MSQSAAAAQSAINHTIEIFSVIQLSKRPRSVHVTNTLASASSKERKEIFSVIQLRVPSNHVKEIFSVIQLSKRPRSVHVTNTLASASS